MEPGPATDEVVAGDAGFALDLLRVLAAEGPTDNLFVSPYSTSVALGMALAGARGRTHDEMARAIGARGDAWHEQRHVLHQQLVRTREAPPGLEPLQLAITNALWAQTGIHVEPAFVDVLAEHYASELHDVDFASSPEDARRAVNAWVAEATADRIGELVPSGAIDARTRLVLVNAVWFLANWTTPFDPDRTADGAFRTADGRTVSVPTMHGQLAADHGRGEGWEAARLRYAGGASMLVIVPTPGSSIDELVTAFDVGALAAVRAALGRRTLRLSLPRFEVTSQLSLPRALQQLGVVDAFTPPSGAGGADFSGMTGERDLYVGDVVHQATITVDEAGTEAAAATAVLMARASLPPPAELAVDRPFLVLIEDDATGAVLFVGQVADPTAG